MFNTLQFFLGLILLLRGYTVLKISLPLYSFRNHASFFLCVLSVLLIITASSADTIPGPPPDGETVLLIYTSATEYAVSLKEAFEKALTSITPPAEITEIEIKSGDGSSPGFYDELVAQTGKKELEEWCQVYDLRFRDDKNNIGWKGQNQEDVLTYIGTNTDWELFDNYLNVGGSLFLQGEHHDYYIRNANLTMFINHVAKKPITQKYVGIHMEKATIQTFLSDPQNFSTDFNNLSGGTITGNFVGGIKLNSVGSGRPITTLDVGAMALAYLPQDLNTTTGRLVVSFESNAFSEPQFQNEISNGWIQNVYDLLSGCYRYELTKTFIPDTVHVNSPGIFTLSYENNGLQSLYNITISDTIPVCLKFISSDPAPTGQTNNFYWWNIPEIKPGTTAKITVNFSPISLPTRTRRGDAHE